MRFFQCTALMALLAVSSSQYLPGGGYLPPRKHMSDSALHKFLSAVRGGGRGHRELMSLTGSASSPSYATLHQGGLGAPPLGPLPAFGLGIGRIPAGVTHVSAPPKIGAFYITPPERNAPSYYSGPLSAPGGGAGSRRPPQLFKLTELKNARPLTLLTSETQNRPRGPSPQQQQIQLQHQQQQQQQGPPPGLQLYQVNGPSHSSLSEGNGGPPPQLFHHPGGFPGGPPFPIQQNIVQTGPTSAGGSQSLQEIIAKAAQQQHAMVLQKEQKAHPNAQITNSEILVPGAGGPAGQQPVFINQFGQPFLAPAIFGPGGPGPQHGPPQQLHPGLIAQLQGQGLLLQRGPPPQSRPQQGRPQQQQQQQQRQNLANLNSINGEIPEGLLKAQQRDPQQQELQLQFLNTAGQQIPGQGFRPQQLIMIPGGQHLPRGLIMHFGGPGGPQTISPNGPILNLPPGILQGNFAVQGPGGQGPFIPGNAILSQPHFALLGNPQQQELLQQQQQIQQQLNHQQQQQQEHHQHGKSADKEEQPTRPQEAASSQHSVVSNDSPVPLTNGHGQMTAAIMQSQVEFAEPLVKM